MNRAVFGTPPVDTAVTPASAVAATDAIAPTVVLGSVSYAPSTADTVAAAIVPTIIFGSLTIQPNSSVAATDASATSVMNSMTIAAASAIAMTDTIAPTIDLGSLVIATSSAITATDAIGPTIELGSLIIEPNSAPAITDGDATPILGSITIDCGAAIAITSATEPIIILGAIEVGTSIAATEATDPIVILGSIDIDSLSAVAVSVVIDPVIRLGPIAYTPLASIADTTINGPTIQLGSLALSLTGVGGTQASDPIVILGSLIITPPSAIASIFGSVEFPVTWMRRRPLTIRNSLREVMRIVNALNTDNFPMQSRLSLSPTDPLDQDITDSTNLYLHPFNGDVISNLIGDFTNLISPLSIAVPNTLFTAFDVFLTEDFNIVTGNWLSLTSTITNVTATTITLFNATGFGIGDLIAITDITGTIGSYYNGNTYIVTSKSTNILTLFGINATGSYTSGGTAHKLTSIGRNNDLTFTNGRLGNSTNLYLGSGITGPTIGKCSTTPTKIHLWNHFNQIPALMYKDAAFDSFDVGTDIETLVNEDPKLALEIFLGYRSKNSLKSSMAFSTVPGGSGVTIKPITYIKSAPIRLAKQNKSLDVSNEDNPPMLNSEVSALLNQGYSSLKMGVTIVNNTGTTSVLGTTNAFAPTTGIMAEAKW